VPNQKGIKLIIIILQIKTVKVGKNRKAKRIAFCRLGVGAIADFETLSCQVIQNFN